MTAAKADNAVEIHYHTPPKYVLCFQERARVDRAVQDRELINDFLTWLHDEGWLSQVANFEFDIFVQKFQQWKLQQEVQQKGKKSDS